MHPFQQLHANCTTSDIGPLLALLVMTGRKVSVLSISVGPITWSLPAALNELVGFRAYLAQDAIGFPRRHGIHLLGLLVT